MKERFDLGTVLFFVLILLIIAVLTFELWVPHPFARHR